MKKFIVAALTLITLSMSSAQARGYGHHHHHGGGSYWAPAIISSAILGTAIYSMSQPRYIPPPPVVYSPPPVYVQPEPVYIPPPNAYPPSKMYAMPYGSRRINVNGINYYEFNGNFFLRNEYGEYVMVRPPY